MDCREGLKQLESDSIDCVIASPPYYNLRNYNIEPSIWGGDLNCEHDFDIKEKKCGGGHSGGVETSGLFTKEQAIKRKEGTGSGNIIKEGFCSKCRAWKGTLGLEPNFELYIKHLCDIYDQIKRVLKFTGTCWVNLGDTYSSKGGLSKPKHIINAKVGATKSGVQKGTRYFAKDLKIPDKCLLMLPQRFAIEMINRGWILRNVIIWHKPNCMPSSARDRFTVDFEQVFLFVKSNKTQYWINEKTAQLISKRPLGPKGIQNIDWEWRECDKCLGTGIKHKKCKACEEEGWIYNTLLQPEKCSYCNGLGRIRQDEECKSCKGKGIKKYNLWKGRQYWFEQQFEKSTTEFIYSRDSKKGENQDKNNPRKNWGKTREEIKIEKSKRYNSKYKNYEHGQTIQGFIRTDSIKEERDQSRIDAQNLFPNDRKKQQEYINHIHDHGKTSNQGRNKRTVWTIPTKPNPEAHFATFPPDLVKPMIKSGCPEFICKECGKPREKIIERIVGDQRSNEPDQKRVKAGVLKGGAKPTTSRPLSDIFAQAISTRMITKGFSDCGCNEGFEPGIVLDPFAGTGTTSKEAWKLGRNYISFEISKEYCKIANKKLRLTKYVRLDNFIEGKIEV